MKHFIAYGLAVTALVIRPATAQLTEDWEHVLPTGVNGFDGHGRSVMMNDGSIVVAGARTNPTPGIAKDVTMARYAPDGTTLWARTFAPAANFDNASDLTLDPGSGDLVLIGATRAAGATDDDLRLSRFDALGNLIWSVTYTTAFNDAGNFVRVDASGAIWVAGRSIDMTPTLNEYPFLFGYTPAGTQFTSVPLPQGYGYFGMQAHPGGGIALTQDFFVTGQFWSLRTCRIDSAGNVVWSQVKPSGIPQFSVRRLVCDAAGNIFVCGAARVGFSSASDALIVKYDANGTEIWSRAYDDGTHFDQFLTSLAVDAQGNVVGVGLSIDVGTYSMLTFALRCNSNGSVSWSRLSNPYGIDTDAYYDVALDAAGGPLIVGSVTEAAPSFVAHGILVRYDRDGVSRGNLYHSAPAGQSSVFLQCFAVANGDYLVSGIGGGLLAARFHEQGVPFCLGDGSGTACPCGNSSPTYDQAGCRHSTTGAARLLDQGIARLTADSLVLSVSGLPSTSPVTFVQGDQRANGGAGLLYGDGLFCLAGSLTRLGTVSASGGLARLGAGVSASISALGHVAAAGVRTYQAIHRSAASFCTPATFNASNGLEITWSP